LLNKSDEFGIKDAMDVLGLISTFIRVVENGSIAAAARAKGMSPAAVSQSLSRLEGHLGVRLLSRTTRSMTLTEMVNGISRKFVTFPMMSNSPRRLPHT
jgi:hypothetical protein